MTLVGADERVDLSCEGASAVAEFLWRGVLPGSALGAQRISDALGTRAASGSIEFERYEWEAVRGAMKALGLLH